MPGTIDQATGMIFWYMLAESLAIMDHPEGWEYAAECFRLSRECVKHMNSVGPVAERQNLAAIANGEALIAFKQHQGEKARQLEEFAVERLKNHIRQVHIKTNLGDVYLRLFGDVESALVQFGGALLAASQACKSAKQPVTPESIRPLRLRAAIKMGSTLMQVGRDEEAMHLLEQLLHDLEKSADLSRRGADYANAVLKTRLALAQVYLKLGRQREAALCYWRVLRHPRWLEPKALREVIAKLHDCRADMPDCLRSRMERIVGSKNTPDRRAKVQEVLAEMQYLNVRWWHRTRCEAQLLGKNLATIVWFASSVKEDMPRSIWANRSIWEPRQPSKYSTRNCLRKTWSDFALKLVPSPGLTPKYCAYSRLWRRGEHTLPGNELCPLRELAANSSKRDVPPFNHCSGLCATGRSCPALCP